MKLDVETYGPPTSLDTHVMVMVFSTSGIERMSSKVNVIGLSTIPVMRSTASSARTCGTVRLVSIRSRDGWIVKVN